MTHPMAEGQKAASPGMKYKHYAPKARVILVDGNQADFAGYVNERKADGVFALCFSEDIAALEVPAVCYGGGKAAGRAGACAVLMRCAGWMIRMRSWCSPHCPNQDGLGLAVYNRLLWGRRHSMW